jgi:hypothetical protein
MQKTPELLALEFAEIYIPYRPWVDQVTHQQDSLVREALQKAWLDGYNNGRKNEWLIKRQEKQARRP